MVAFIKTPNSVTFQFTGKRPVTLPASSQMAKDALDLVRKGATDAEIFNAVNIISSVRKHSTGLFDVNDAGEVSVRGEILPKSLSKRIVDFADEGVLSQVGALVRFWDNCCENPDPRAKTDLYAFMEHNNIPVTPDGCFIAYRSVIRRDGILVDRHSGKFVNEPGSVCEMPREEVDSNPDQTCSNGLHVAAFEYAQGFADVLLAVKVNPKDVVAIPTDYNGQKMRVCRFVVMEIVDEIARSARPLEGCLYDCGCEDDEDEDWDDEEDEDWDDEVDEETECEADGSFFKHSNGTVQKRDASGRFLPRGY